MKKLLSLTIFIAVLTLSCGNKKEVESVTKAYPLYVENYQFKKDGYTFLVRGINVAERWKYGRRDTEEIYPYLGKVTEGTFRWLRVELGFNFVRLLTFWAAIEPEKGRYDTGYIKEYARRVTWASKNNIFTFVDMHQDVYGEGFYKYGGDGAPLWSCPSRYYLNQPDMPSWEFGYLTGGPVACFKRLWTNEDNLWDHYAEAIKNILSPIANNDHLVGVEIINEPFWGPWGPVEFEEKYLYKFYIYMGKEIRRVAPQKIIFVEPAASKNLGFSSYLPPLPLQQLAYAPHFYPTSLFLGQPYPGGMTDTLEEGLRERIGEGIKLNAVTIIGEFGAWSDKKTTVNYLRDFFNAAERLKMGVVLWELNDLEQRFEKKKEWKEWITTVVRAYPEMWKGDLIRFKYYPDSYRLHIIWRARSGKDMIITLPHLIFKGKCSITPVKDLSLKWINSYQIRITAEKSGVFDFTVEK